MQLKNITAVGLYFIFKSEYLKLGLFELKNCFLLVLESVNFENILGEGNLITITNSDFAIINSSLKYVVTHSTFVFQIIYSNFTMNNTINSNFYPQLIYGTFSFLNISNNSFLNSTENYGFFQVIAISIEHNASFEISNNRFEKLKNNLNGPVLRKFFFF